MTPKYTADTIELENLVEASVNLCAYRESEMIEFERRQRYLVAQSARQLVNAVPPASTARPSSGDVAASVVPAVTGPPSVAAQLERLRVESDITQEWLAELVNLDIRTVQRHLSGATTPNSRLLYRYNAAFSNLLNRQVVISELS